VAITGYFTIVDLLFALVANIAEIASTNASFTMIHLVIFIKDGYQFRIQTNGAETLLLAASF
jgi:hypothetical protein